MKKYDLYDEVRSVLEDHYMSLTAAVDAASAAVIRTPAVGVNAQEERLAALQSAAAMTRSHARIMGCIAESNDIDYYVNPIELLYVKKIEESLKAVCESLYEDDSIKITGLLYQARLIFAEVKKLIQ